MRTTRDELLKLEVLLLPLDVRVIFSTLRWCAGSRFQRINPLYLFLIQADGLNVRYSRIELCEEVSMVIASRRVRE